MEHFQDIAYHKCAAMFIFCNVHHNATVSHALVQAFR
jgi:hypothetical protein